MPTFAAGTHDHETARTRPGERLVSAVEDERGEVSSREDSHAPSPPSGRRGGRANSAARAAHNSDDGAVERAIRWKPSGGDT